MAGSDSTKKEEYLTIALGESNFKFAPAIESVY